MKKYIKTTIKSLLEDTKNRLKEQLSKRNVGIYLYIILRFLCDPWTNSVLKRLEQNHYKALARLNILSGRQFLKQFISASLNDHLSNWFAQSASYRSKHPIELRVDGTKTGYRYGRMIPELRRLYDYVKHNYLLTYELYVLLLSIGSKDYIADFVLIPKDRPLTQGNEPDQGVNAVVIHLFDSLRKLIGSKTFVGIRQCGRISLDGTWGKEAMLNWFHHHGFRQVVTKSGGVGTLIDGQEPFSLAEWKASLIDLLTPSDWKTFNPCHRLGTVSYFDEELTFKKTGLLQAVINRFKRYFLELDSKSLQRLFSG